VVPSDRVASAPGGFDWKVTFGLSGELSPGKPEQLARTAPHAAIVIILRIQAPDIFRSAEPYNTDVDEQI
jgi:hypothetical protein